MDFDDLLGRLARHLFDLHAARGGGHHHRLARGAVVGDAEVDLGLDGGGLVHQHFADGESFDLHFQDLRGELLRFFRAFGDFHAAGFAASAYQHLGFDDGASAEFLGGPPRFFRVGRHPSFGDGDSIFGEDQFGLVFVEFHGVSG